ncbi:MAG: hypothetical protein ACSHWU_11510 [Marinicella sp.]
MIGVRLILLIIIFQLSSAIGLAQQDIVEIGYENLATVQVSNLNTSNIIVYFKDGPRNKKHIYVPPYLSINLNVNTASWKEYCESVDQSTLVRIPFNYAVRTKTVDDEIMASLKADLDSANNSILNDLPERLTDWPTKYIELFGVYVDDDLNEVHVPIHQYPTIKDVSEIGAIDNNLTLSQVGRNAKIRNTCDVIKRLLEENNFYIYYTTPVISTAANWVSVALKQFYDSSHFDDLIRTEDQSGSVSTITKMERNKRGHGLSLGGFRFNTGSKDAKGESIYTDSRKRYVNAKFIQKVSQAYLADYGIISNVSADSPEFNINNVVDLISKDIIEDLDPIKFEIDQERRKLIDGAIERSMTSSELSRLKANNKFISDQNHSHKLKFKKGDAGTEEDITEGESFTDDRGVDYTFDNTQGWVPTSLTLYSSSDIQKKSSFDSYNTQFTRIGDSFFKRFRGEVVVSPVVAGHVKSSYAEFRNDLIQTMSDKMDEQIIKFNEKLESLRPTHTYRIMNDRIQNNKDNADSVKYCTNRGHEEFVSSTYWMEYLGSGTDARTGGTWRDVSEVVCR